MAASRPHRSVLFTLILLAGFVPAGPYALAQTVAEKTLASEPAGALPLYLAVFINGHDTKLIANFAQHTDGRFSSPASELHQLGIRVPDGAGTDVFLDQLPGLTFAYDEQAQAMSIMADDAALVPKTISGSGKTDLLAPQPGFGAVLNYGVYATTSDRVLDGEVEPSGVALGLDSRVYSPWGVLTNIGAVRAPGLSYEGGDSVRTDSYFTHVDQQNMTTYTVGDVISSSLPWSRPIRLGGAQVRRDFGLRADVIATPLLTATGSAAVPSTVDVYIGNIRTFTGQVDPGPFVLTDVPLIDQHGDARIVLRDVSGRETEVSVPFYASQDLLKQGMMDYSLEGGVARRDYGQDSFSYDTEPLASASLRYGLTDRVTLEAHAEGKSDLQMGGAGLTTVLFNRAEVSIAGGGSLYDGKTGLFAYGRISTDVAGVSINASSFRSFGDFADLAYATGRDEVWHHTDYTGYNYMEPAKAMDVVSLGVPLYFDPSSVSLSFIHAQRKGEDDYIASAGYSRGIGWRDATLQFNGFYDVGDRGGLGLFAGFSMPLGGQRYLNVGVARDRDGAVKPAVGVQKPLDSEVGSYGYRVETAGTDIYGQGGVGGSYRSSFGVADARLQANEGRISASGSFDGALVAADGSVFASNTIYDSFAVVDAGLPGVPVLLQNRPVAVTGHGGKALVTGLRSYSNNKVSLDVTGLPVDATVSATDETVIPARRSGVTVDFHGGVKAAALVILRDPSGNFVDAGSVVALNGGAAENYVGYDGQLWLEELKPSNTITVENDKGHCTASFTYTPDPGNQVTIDPVECK